MDILGKPLNDETTHRIDQVGELTGLAPDDMIDPAAVAKVITSQQGGLKNVPDTARVWAVLTKWAPEVDQVAQEVAAEIFARAAGRLEGVALIPKAPIAELASAEIIVLRR